MIPPLARLTARKHLSICPYAKLITRRRCSHPRHDDGPRRVRRVEQVHHDRSEHLQEDEGQPHPARQHRVLGPTGRSRLQMSQDQNKQVISFPSGLDFHSASRLTNPSFETDLISSWARWTSQRAGDPGSSSTRNR